MKTSTVRTLDAAVKALAEAPEAPLFLPERAEYVLQPDFTVDKAPDGAKSPNLADSVMIVYAPSEPTKRGFFDL